MATNNIDKKVTAQSVEQVKPIQSTTLVKPFVASTNAPIAPIQAGITSVNPQTINPISTKPKSASEASAIAYQKTYNAQPIAKAPTKPIQQPIVNTSGNAQASSKAQSVLDSIGKTKTLAQESAKRSAEGAQSASQSQAVRDSIGATKQAQKQRDLASEASAKSAINADKTIGRESAIATEAKAKGFNNAEDYKNAEALGMTKEEYDINKEYNIQKAEFIRKQGALEQAQIESFQQQLRNNGVLDDGVGIAAEALLRGKAEASILDGVQALDLQEREAIRANNDKVANGFMNMYYDAYSKGNYEEALGIAETLKDISPFFAKISQNPQALQDSMNPQIRENDKLISSDINDLANKLVENDADFSNYAQNMAELEPLYSSISGTDLKVDAFANDFSAGRLGDDLAKFNMPADVIQKAIETDNKEILKSAYIEYDIKKRMADVNKVLFQNETMANATDLIDGGISEQDANVLRDYISNAPDAESLNKILATTGNELNPTSRDDVFIEDWNGNVYNDTSYENRSVYDQNMDKLWTHYKDANPEDDISRTEFLKKYGGIAQQNTTNVPWGSNADLDGIITQGNGGAEGSGSLDTTNFIKEYNDITSDPNVNQRNTFTDLVSRMDKSSFDSAIQNSDFKEIMLANGVVENPNFASLESDDASHTIKNKLGITATDSENGDGNGTIIIKDNTPYRIQAIYRKRYSDGVTRSIPAINLLTGKQEILGASFRG